MTRAQLTFLQQRRDHPKSYPDWGGSWGVCGPRYEMAVRLREQGYLRSWSDEDCHLSWKITDKGLEALAGHGR